MVVSKDMPVVDYFDDDSMSLQIFYDKDEICLKALTKFFEVLSNNFFTNFDLVLEKSKNNALLSLVSDAGNKTMMP